MTNFNGSIQDTSFQDQHHADFSKQAQKPSNLFQILFFPFNSL